MNKGILFSSADSIGSMDPSSISEYLQEIGDFAAAAEILGGGVSGQGLLSRCCAYTRCGLSLGYVECSSEGHRSLDISGAAVIQADRSLVGQRLKITLDKFYVHSYPGLGKHRVLCEFAGKNQVAQEAEELRFALQTQVGDGESASISGHPIFMGVTVGNDGICFEGRTINIGSTIDDTVLATLDSPAFKSGLSLITTMQPALKPFAGLSASVVTATLTRARNKQVHNFNLGLDFGGNSTSARLRIGSYIVAQTGGGPWNWNDYVWDRNSMSIVVRSRPEKQPEVNYMVFGVSPFSSGAV